MVRVAAAPIVCPMRSHGMITSIFGFHGLRDRPVLPPSVTAERAPIRALTRRLDRDFRPRASFRSLRASKRLNGTLYIGRFSNEQTLQHAWRRAKASRAIPRSGRLRQHIPLKGGRPRRTTRIGPRADRGPGFRRLPALVPGSRTSAAAEPGLEPKRATDSPAPRRSAQGAPPVPAMRLPCVASGLPPRVLSTQGLSAAGYVPMELHIVPQGFAVAAAGRRRSSPACSASSRTRPRSLSVGARQRQSRCVSSRNRLKRASISSRVSLCSRSVPNSSTANDPVTPP